MASVFIEGVNWQQSTLFSNRLEDRVGEDNPVRCVEPLIAASILRKRVSGARPRLPPDGPAKPARRVSTLQPILAAIELIVAHSEGCAPRR